MFERYTEGARRTIFFARYEASQYGSPYIETDHLLLGLMREWKWLTTYLPDGSSESIRAQIAASGSHRNSTSTAIDLPLSLEGKRVLAYGAEEAERLAHKHIGSEHLLLGLLREEKCFAARMLHERGVEISKLRLEFAKTVPESWPRKDYTISARGSRVAIHDTVEIHGSAWHASYVRKAIDRCRKYSWHWHKCPWRPRDIVIDLKSGAFSFVLELAEDSANFRLVKGGWTKDHCAVCRWELFESKDDPERGTGYTNGRDWLCTQCYEKFWKGPDFFSSTYSEIT
ncbi:MAG: Clp protease N-terminal domain-containing protein [Terriglobales bacterium]|jgi:hypothetical protein